MPHHKSQSMAAPTGLHWASQSPSLCLLGPIMIEQTSISSPPRKRQCTPPQPLSFFPSQYTLTPFPSTHYTQCSNTPTPHQVAPSPSASTPIPLYPVYPIFSVLKHPFWALISYPHLQTHLPSPSRLQLSGEQACVLLWAQPDDPHCPSYRLQELMHIN